MSQILLNFYFSSKSLIEILDDCGLCRIIWMSKRRVLVQKKCGKFDGHTEKTEWICAAN